MTGTVNTAGSTVSRRAGDGGVSVFTYNAGRGCYVSTDGDGPYDTIQYSGGTWNYTDQSTQLTETYDPANGNRIAGERDSDGNTLTFTYTGNTLIRVTTANGERTDYSYTGNNLSQVVITRADGTTETRVHYGYDTSNGLSSVTTDLTPDDNSIADGKKVTTTYTYDGTS